MWKPNLIRRSFPIASAKPRSQSPAPWVFPVPRFTLRMAATFIDWSILTLALLVLLVGRSLAAGLAVRYGWATPPALGLRELSGTILAGFFLYFGVSYRFLGTTVGKAIFQIRLERALTRARVGFIRAFLREFLLKALPLGAAAVAAGYPSVRAWFPGAYLIVACLPVLQALFFGLFRTDGRLLADLLLGTRVVGAPRSGWMAQWFGRLTSRRALAFQATLGIALLLGRFGEEARWMVARPADLYERYRGAIVRIEILHLGTPVSTGTGFFVSGDGIIVTNDHVLAPALRPGMGAVFYLADGTRIDRFQIGGCSDDRNIDLCVARLPVRPKVWLHAKRDAVTVGDEALVIGHPLRFDFSMSQGIVSGLRTDSRSRQANYRVGSEASPVPTIQFTAPISPGNSGGPVFNRYGELLGVATSAYFDPTTVGLNFGIEQSEVFRYLARNSQWRDPQSESREILSQQKDEELRLAKDVFAPAFDAVERGAGLDAAHFRHVSVEFATTKFGFWLPRDVIGPSPDSGCEKSLSGLTVIVTCPDYRAEGEIRIEMQQVEKGSLKYAAMATRPGSFLGFWDSMGVDTRARQAALPDVHEARAEVFHCESYRSGGLRASSGTICQQTAYNVPRPNSVTHLVVAQRDEDGMLMRAFGVSDSRGFMTRVVGGAQIAARSMEFEGFMGPNGPLAADVVEFTNRSLSSISRRGNGR